MNSENSTVPDSKSLDTLVTLFNHGKYTELESFARIVTSRYPKHGFAWKILGTALFLQGRNAEALGPMRTATELFQADIDSHNILGAIFNGLGKFLEAEACFRRVLQIKPDLPEAHNNLGAVLNSLQRFSEAEVCFCRVLQIKPDLPEAYNNLGNAIKELGRLSEAADSFRHALQIKPDYFEAYNNLGITQNDLGQLDEAEASYRQALQINPNCFEAYNNLGITLKGLERLEEAEACHRRALEIKPDFAEAHNDLGITLKDLGRLDEAEASYRQALKHKPDYSDVYNNLGVAHKDLGQLEEAEACYRRALEIEPDFAEAYNNLGIVLKDLGRPKEAEACYRLALKNKPDFAEAHNNLGITLKDFGRLEEAEACYCRSLEIKPDCAEVIIHLASLFNAQGEYGLALNTIRFALQIKESVEAKTVFAYCVNHIHWTQVDSDIRTCIVRALTEPWVRPNDLARICTDLIMNTTDIGECAARATAAWPCRLLSEDLYEVNSLAKFAVDPLLCGLLSSAPICNIEMEHFLTMARSAMLNVATEVALPDSDTATTALGFYSALARQCFTNEYVFSYTDDENKKACKLRDLLAKALDAGTGVPDLWLVAVAAYFPLCSLPNSIGLFDNEWPEAVMGLLVQQVREPDEEIQLRASIPRLTVIDQEISLQVQNQYEENPYPRWVKSEPAGKPKYLVEYLRQKFPLAPIVNDLKSGSINVLIAGCGTGQHPIGTAQIFQGAEVLAIDLSISSLCYAKRKTRELGLTSIEYAQADLLKLNSLGRSFDLIESCGVLHHLADPFAGWRILLSLLRPGGFMRIGLYSELARRNIVKARDVIARLGYGDTSNEIRQCRQDLIDRFHSTYWGNTFQSADFYSMSTCRDLLFHVQEHLMTLTGIDEFLRRNNLLFLGFEIADEILSAYRRRFPDDYAATNLGQWQAFETENPDSFSGMYQFWVQKID